MAAGQRNAGGMVAHHRTVTVQCRDRLIEIDLHKTGLALWNRPAAQHRGAPDNILGADMQMHRHAVTQLDFSVARGAKRKIDPAHLQMALGGDEPIAAIRLATVRE